MPLPTALYDANVLYPATLRDVLVELATAGLFRARWTDAIHDEWTRNLLADRPDLSPAAVDRVRRLVDAAVPDCLVTGYEPLVAGLDLPDPGDRHVPAAGRGRAPRPPRPRGPRRDRRPAPSAGRLAVSCWERRSHLAVPDNCRPDRVEPTRQKALARRTRPPRRPARKAPYV